MQSAGPSYAVSVSVHTVLFPYLSAPAARFFPTVGAAVFAIGLGILCGNTFLNHAYLNAGTSFSERNLLEYSIVLTGATLMLKDIFSLGLGGLLFIAFQMTGTIAAAYLIGRRMKFSRKFSLLISAGNAVCGSSAIATVSPVLKADAKEKGISVTIVNLTGTILMILLPLVTQILYHHEMLPTTAMTGGVLQSIGQVIASADLIGQEYIAGATIFKILRIVFIVFVALAFSRMNATEEGKLFDRTPSGNNAVRTGIPWFIIGFFLMAVLYTIGLIPESLSDLAHTISGQFEIIALAAIGMRVKFRDLAAEGPKALCYGLAVGTVQILLAAILIRVFLHY